MYIIMRKYILNLESWILNHRTPWWAVTLSKIWRLPSSWYQKRCCLISSAIDWLNLALKLSNDAHLEDLLNFLTKIINCSRNLKVTQFLSMIPTVPFILTNPKAFSLLVIGFSWSEFSKGFACIHNWYTNLRFKIIWYMLSGISLQRGHGLLILCHLLYECCV